MSVINLGSNKNIYQILFTIIYVIKKESESQLYMNSIDHENIARAILFIEDNLMKVISLDAVAEYACLSKYHLFRVFKDITGFTMKEYIRKRRLSKAAERLILTKKDLTTIASESHFGSRESFIRAFKKHYATTPDQFRNGVHEEKLFDAIPLTPLYDSDVLILKPYSVVNRGFNVVSIGVSLNFFDPELPEQMKIFRQECFAKCIFDSVIERNERSKLIQIGKNPDYGSGQFEYEIGFRIPTQKKVPKELTLTKIDGIKYMVFPVYADSVGRQKAWDHINELCFSKEGRKIFCYDAPVLEIADVDKDLKEAAWVHIYYPVL